MGSKTIERRRASHFMVLFTFIILGAFIFFNFGLAFPWERIYDKIGTSGRVLRHVFDNLV